MSAPIIQRCVHSSRVIALHAYSDDIIEKIARFNGGLTIEQVDDALRRGHKVFSSFSCWSRVGAHI